MQLRMFAPPRKGMKVRACVFLFDGPNGANDLSDPRFANVRLEFIETRFASRLHAQVESRRATRCVLNVH